MKLPRDISGLELSHRLSKFGYRIVRQTGSHIRLTSNIKFKEHHVTIPHHTQIKVGTLAGILDDIASYLGIDRSRLVEELFK